MLNEALNQLKSRINGLIDLYTITLDFAIIGVIPCWHLFMDCIDLFIYFSTAPKAMSIL